LTLRSYRGAPDGRADGASGRAGRLVTQYYGRSAWTSAPRPVDRLVPLEVAHVRGIAVHHTGRGEPLGSRTCLQQSARRLEEDRLAAVRGRGWTDVAYQVAVDADGRVFDCRGLEHRPQANGNPTANARFGAAMLLLGTGEEPTGAMVEAFRDWRRTRWLARYPQAAAIVGHRDLYPTACPGDAVHALVRAGTLADADPTDGGSVVLTDDEIDAIATRTRDRILAVTYGNHPDGRPFTLGMLWGEVRINAARAATGVDVEALAEAVVARLPRPAAAPDGTAIDPHTLAVAVADEIAARLRPAGA